MRPVRKNKPAEPDRESGIRQKGAPGMLPIVPNFKIPEGVAEEAKNALLAARRKVAGVFADDQPSLFPELDEEPGIPADRAEEIIKEARAMIDDDKNVEFRIEEGEVKIDPVYRSEDAWEDLGYPAK